MSNDINFEPVKKKRKVLIFVWILPLIAICIASWMVYKHYNEMAEEITVVFKNADGFVVGKTPLKYKGIKGGVVSNIQIDEKNINNFLVTIKIGKDVKEAIAREGTQFWKVEPKVTLSEISGLNTILSGNYIEVRLANKDFNKVLEREVQTYFTARESKPIELFQEDGTFVTLKSNQGNLSVGSPVLYKSFIVGEVLQKSLQGHDVLYKIFIQKKYETLLKEDSSFWNVSGVDVKASLSGLNMKIDNLQSLIIGGIAFDSNKDSNLLKNRSKVFQLYSSKDEVGFSEEIIELRAKDAYKLEKEFSKVYYQGLAIGKVVNIVFNAKNQETIISIKLKNKYVDFLNYAPHFQIIKPEISLNKVTGLSSLIKSNYIKLTLHSKKSITKKEDMKRHFVLSEKSKRINMYKVTLYTSLNTKINKNSPIFYKNVKVGYVDYKSLDKKNNRLKIVARIYWIHRNLINDTSLFYEQSPVEFSASLKEISLKTAPIKSFINSGIAIETLNLKKKSTKKVYTLYGGYKQMKHAQYFLSKGSYYRIKVSDISQLKTDDIIYYKGIEAGKVLQSQFDETEDQLYFEIFILKRFDTLLNNSSKFYSISGIDVDLSLDKLNIKTKSLETLVNGGISFYTPNTNALKVKKNHLFAFYKTLNDAKEEFVEANIKMARGFNLKVGSKILYKDLLIGNVKALNFTKDDKVMALVLIKKEHKKLLNKNTLFYLDDFKFSLNKIENPSGALLGSNIKVIAGNSLVQQNNFELLTYRPIEGFDKEGLRVIVKAKLKSSLKQNSPVYYRQLQIGVVEKYELSKESTHVKLQLFIEEKYAHLIRENSIFYNAGAFGVDLYLFGVKIKTETLETLISGGISLVTPTKYGKAVKSMHSFELKQDLDEDWLQWNPKIKRE